MSYYLRPKKFTYTNSEHIRDSANVPKRYRRFESSGMILFVSSDLCPDTVFYPSDYVKHIETPLNERVRRYREIKKWTQADLAKKAGITQGEVSVIECGSSQPGIGTIKKLQKAFNLDFMFFA